jgi:uncharacterized membrane protein
MLIDGPRLWLTVAALTATGLMAGFFFAWSTIGMLGLRRAPDEQGLRVMQEINRAANASTIFLLGFLGTPALCVAVGVSALTNIDHVASAYQLVASALYLVGAFGLTLAYHIPRNNELDRLDPDAPESVASWRHYSTVWTAWNHVRTVAPLASTVLYAFAIRAR